MEATITTYTADGAVEVVETVTLTVINSAADLEAFFASVLPVEVEDN